MCVEYGQKIKMEIESVLDQATWRLLIYLKRVVFMETESSHFITGLMMNNR